jgi:hypothetical protein
MSNSESKNLHFGFIDFLFSLAVAQVAVKFAAIVANADDTVRSYSDSNYWPAYSHLALCLMLITTSWIGWNSSLYSHSNTRNIASVWNLDFLEIFIDVLLVISYYVLVEHTEMPPLKSAATTAQLIAPQGNSILPEAHTLIVVFGLYLLWDFVSKFPFRLDANNRRNGWDPIMKRGWISAVCFLLAWLLYMLAPGNPSNAQIVLLDFSLFGLVALFRDLKAESCDRFGFQKSWRIYISLVCLIAPLLLLWLGLIQ